MSFGYPQQYANGLNTNSQIRRSTDMINQRGANYQVLLTGSTYIPSMELDVDMYVNDELESRLQLVPFSIKENNSNGYDYKFNIRPYDFYVNYVQSEHYKYYYINDWYQTNSDINMNRDYTNIVKANYKFGYRYISGATVVTEYTGGTPTNDYNHYTVIPIGTSYTGFTASGYTNTGKYFDYVGGQFQLQDHYILQNFDQEVGTTITSGGTLYTLDVNRDLSPMSQFYMDGPSLPSPSTTARFLTESPRIQYIQDYESYSLSFLNGLTGDRQYNETDFAVFKFYNENNTLVNYFEQEINFSGTSWATPTTAYTDNLRVWFLPCGPVEIDNIFSTIAWSGVAYYTVQLYYGLPTDDPNRQSTGPIGPSSERFYFYLYENCLPQNTRIAWLNSKGGYDYFTFRSYRQDIKKINRTTFDNRYYATYLTSPDRDYGRSVKNLTTDVVEEFVLESEFLSVSYGEWLEELFLSPQVYEVKEDYISPLDRQDKVYKDLRPVQILSTEVEKINTKHRKLNKYRITMKYATSYFTNNGF